MYRLHIANRNYSSWSLRPWVLMRVLDIPFDEELHVFGVGSNFAAFRSFSPSGRVPCLHDGDLAVWDSLAITEYLAESHPRVWPTDSRARAWARSAAAEMHSGFGELRGRCGMTCGQRIRLREMPPALMVDLDRLAGLWTKGLSRFGGPWLTGASFTAADAFYAPVAFRFQTYGLSCTGAVADYVQRLLALPAMVAWYDAALAEPWRDPLHEAEVRRFGTVTADLRVPAAS